MTSMPVTETFASLEVHREMDLFLAQEAELADSRRYWEWAELNWSEKNNPFFTEETNLYLNVQSEEKNS